MTAPSAEWVAEFTNWIDFDVHMPIEDVRNQVARAYEEATKKFPLRTTPAKPLDVDVETANDIVSRFPSAMSMAQNGKLISAPILIVPTDIAKAIAEALTAIRADYEEVLADKRRLARELDVALHGEEGAAKQASLCDLIEPAKKLRLRVSELQARARSRGALKDLDYWCKEHGLEPTVFVLSGPAPSMFESECKIGVAVGAGELRHGLQARVAYADAQPMLDEWALELKSRGWRQISGFQEAESS